MRVLILLCLSTTFGCARVHTNTFMWSHYDAAYDAHDALLRGSLMRAQAAGQWLADHPERGMPEGSAEYVRDMQRYARDLATSNDLTTASLSTAGIAQACGECHKAFGPGPLFLGQGAPPPSLAGQPRREMQRHSWAAARLWEGLVGPSDAAWETGSEVLRDAAMSGIGDSLPPGVQEEIAALEERVHEIGRMAATATGADRRLIYGNLIATCTQCHSLARR